MITKITVNNYPIVFDTLVSIITQIFDTNATTVALLDNFNSNPSYVFVDALRQTMHNMCDILDASLFNYGLSIAQNNLEQVEALSLPISFQDANYLSTRTNGMGTALNYLQTNIYAMVQPISTLISGTPMVSSVGYLEYLAQFDAETVPSSVSAVSDIASGSTDEAAAWLRIQTAAINSGQSFSASILDTLLYMNSIQSNLNAYNSNFITLSNALPVSTVWNYVIANWTYQDTSSIYWNDPSNATIQASLILRYALKQAELTCADLLLAFMNQLSTNIKTAPLLENQSLMDLANAQLGDYTQWTAIAQANGLLPPYTSSSPSPNLASPGQNLFLPGSTPQGAIGSYILNFLGSDINFGIPGQQMPPWTGDFQTVNGYTNLNYALARRILTPLGSLLYHASDYGSLINQIGQPLTAASIATILAYAQAALLSDPRVASIVDVSANLVNSTQLSIYTEVRAAGGPAQNTSINVILQPGAVAQSGN